MQFFTAEEIQAMEFEKLFIFKHHFGFETRNFLKNKHLKHYKVIADIKLDKKEIVVLIKHKKYPFFGS